MFREIKYRTLYNINNENNIYNTIVININLVNN